MKNNLRSIISAYPFPWLSVAFVLLCMRISDIVQGAAAGSLGHALTFHASFDHGPDADYGQGDRRIFTAPSMKHPRIGTPGLPANDVVSIAKGEGKVGDALRFHRKAGVPGAVLRAALAEARPRCRRR